MKMNIIVADDETPICEWIAYCIQKAPEKHHVVTASNGNEALDLILRNPPDLVFTDIRMPGMDGLELMRRVKDVYPYVIFVILSNYAEFAYAQQALTLGALDYVLKSELRSQDIQIILEKVLEKKELSLQEKQGDLFRSGCIDLSNYYSKQNEPDFSRKFWTKLGMEDMKPYLLLSFPPGKNQDDWVRAAQIANSLQNELGQETYAAAASETGRDYFIIQSNGNLREMAAAAAQRISFRGNTGISRIYKSLDDFSSALKESSCAKTAVFFSETDNYLFFSSLDFRKKLNRDDLREQKKHILELISQKRFSQAKSDVEKWFEQISNPEPDDVLWAVDACQRMVMSIEERYYQLKALAAPPIEIQKSAANCIVRCRELVDEMQQIQSGQCSEPIASALDYIHEHYAEQISMVEVAQHVFRSPEYFSRQFKEEVGENFITYLTLYRLDRAQEMLRQTDLRIGEIANKVGYPTPGYFSRIYKRYKGVSPEQERESSIE